MPERSSIVAFVRTVSIPVNDGGDAVTVKWKPAGLTPDVWDALVAIGDKEKSPSPFQAANTILVPLMTAWDVTDGGKPLEITADNIASFGLEFVLALSFAIQEDFNLGKDAKKGSGGG